MTELAARLASASRMQRQQSYLMAAAGHDLKQPLQVILMVMNRLMPQLAPRDRTYAEIALAEIGQLGRGLNELALAAQFAADATPAPHLVRFPASEVIEQVAASWCFHAAIKGLAIRARPSREVILSNRNLVTTVLRNFVGNAIKYTERGGVLISCRRYKGRTRIEVWDSGPGIEEHQLRPITEPLHQADPTKGGLGLGLAISRHAADLLGATIEVDTRPGLGSRFALCLPERPGPIDLGLASNDPPVGPKEMSND